MQYGKLHLDSLKQNRPEDYARLTPLERDNLQQSIQESAEHEENEVYNALLKKHPAPAKEPQRSQHLSGLAASAREQVLYGIYVPDKETAEALSNGRQGYLDPESEPASVTPESAPTR